MAPVSERPQAEETSRASTLLSPCAPQAARARAAARGRLRALRAGGRRRLHRRAARPQGLNQRTDRQTRGLSRPAPAPRLRLRSASTLRPPPSAPPPQLHLARRSGGMPGTCVYGRDGRTPSISHQSPLYLPSISPRSPPRSQARDQRRATSTGVPPQRQGGGAALPRGALPVLHRLARSVRGRKPGGRVQVMPTWQP